MSLFSILLNPNCNNYGLTQVLCNSVSLILQLSNFGPIWSYSKEQLQNNWSYFSCSLYVALEQQVCPPCLLRSNYRHYYTAVKKFSTKVIGSKTVKRLINHHSLMDWSLRMKFFPAKLLDKEISVGVIVTCINHGTGTWLDALIMVLFFTFGGYLMLVDIWDSY